MPIRPVHLVRQAICLAAVALALGILTGCQAVVNNQPLSQVRIINASPDSPGLDIYEGNTALAHNLGFGSVTSYIPVSPGAYTFSTDSTGTRQTLTTSKATLAANGQYTILIGDVAASLQQQILTDQSLPASSGQLSLRATEQSLPASSGQVSLRFIDQATRIGAVDIYLIPNGQKLTAVTPLVTGIVFSANTGYLTIPTGTYTLVVTPAGTIPGSSTVATYTGAQITYAAGAASTIVLIDKQQSTTPGLQVITADDFDSPTAS